MEAASTRTDVDDEDEDEEDDEDDDDEGEGWSLSARREIATSFTGKAETVCDGSVSAACANGGASLLLPMRGFLHSGRQLFSDTATSDESFEPKSFEVEVEVEVMSMTTSGTLGEGAL